MKRLLVFLFFAAALRAQTINPNQIRPSTTNGYVLTTVGGATVWAPGGGGGSCGALSGDATSTNCGNGNFTSAGTTSNDQVYGYTNFNTVAASHSVAVGDANFESVVGSTGLNTTNLIGIGSGNMTNVTSPSDQPSGYLIGIGNSNFVNAAGRNLYALGDSNFDNVPSISSFDCGYSHVDVGIGSATASGWTVPYNDVVAIGDGAGSNYGQLGYTTPSCTYSGIVAIGSGAGSINGVFQFTGGPVFAPSVLVGVGEGAAANNGGTDIVGVGDASAAKYLPGSADIIGIGDASMIGPSSLSGGHQVVNATIHDAIGIGDFSGNCNAANEVIAMGDTALSAYGTSGLPCTGNTGDDNIAIGDHANPANSSGTHNTVIGNFAGGVGWTSVTALGNSNRTGSQNTWIGDNSGPNTTTQLSNTIALGYNAAVSVSNQTVIGNSSITAVTIFGVGTGCLSASSGVITGSGSPCGTGGGGGSNVTVNGGAALATANFGSLPAAGANGLNVTWQNTGANVSAEIVGDGNAAHFLNGTGGWTTPAGGGSSAFSAITSGTNTTAAMVVGAGGSLNFTSTGTINASSVGGVALSGLCQTSGTGCPAGGSGTVIDGAGTTTAGLIAESTTTLHGIDYNSSLDNGHTTANTLTYSGSGGMALTGGTTHKITMGANSGGVITGSTTTAVSSTDASGNYFLSENGSTPSRYCTSGNGQCAAPPQNRAAGSLTLGQAPDSMFGDRHVFNLRLASGEFDSGSPFPVANCPNDTCTGTQYGARTLINGPYTSLIVRCKARANSGSDVSACAGVTAVPGYYGAYFLGANLVYNYSGGSGTATTLTTGNIYRVWTMENNGFASIGWCPSPSPSMAGCGTQVIDTTAAPPIVTAQEQTSGAGTVSSMKYAADNISGSSPLFPNMIPVVSPGEANNAPLPILTYVPSNPAGSNVNFTVILASNYNPAATNPWVMWIQGDGGLCADIFNIAVDTQMADGLLAAGYSLVCTDFTSQTDWGNPASGLDLTSALAQARLEFNLDPRPYVYAASMGGMRVLNAITHGIIQPRAMEMAFPAYSMSNIYAGGSGGFNSQLQTAYSCSSVPTCNAAFVGYDPSAPVSGATAALINKVPMDVRCSASDTTINCAANGQALVTAVTAAGGTATFTACTGAHGDPSCVLPAAAIDYFNKH